MSERLIVIGGVAAGMSAAAKAKRTNRDLEVVVYERSRYISYAACGMPYFIAGDIADADELIVRTPAQMGKQGVQVHVRHEVTAIDPGARTVTVRDLEGEREFVQDYDKLVIATGARAGLAAAARLRSWRACSACAPWNRGWRSGVLSRSTSRSGPWSSAAATSAWRWPRPFAGWGWR